MSADHKLLSLGTAVDKARDLSYTPTEAQRKIKSRFWSYFSDSGTLPPSQIDLATALMYGADRGLSEWWDLPGFSQWFANKDEFRQRLEYLAQRAVDELEKILNDNNPMGGSTKVSAIKLIMDIANKQPKSTAEKFLDERIGKMSQQELEDFIKKNVTRLTPPTK